MILANYKTSLAPSAQYSASIMTITGRGRGRGSTFSGRGRSGRFTKNRSQQKTESKKTLSDYTYYIGSAKQASDYNTVTKFLINYI